MSPRRAGGRWIGSFLAAGGDGFAICDVRRREDELRDWLDTVLLPAVSAVGRTAQPTTVPPVWSFARP